MLKLFLFNIKDIFLTKKAYKLAKSGFLYLQILILYVFYMYYVFIFVRKIS